MSDFFGFLMLAAVLLLPGVGAYFLSRKVHRALKKGENKRATVAAVGTFIVSYLVTLAGIVVALAFFVPFRR